LSQCLFDYRQRSKHLVKGSAKVIYQYVPQKPNGTPDTPVTLKWDVTASKEF